MRLRLRHVYPDVRVGSIVLINQTEMRYNCREQLFNAIAQL